MALIKELNRIAPRYDESCYFSENATIVGDVSLGKNCSVWFSSVVRGDVAPVTIGNGVNIQDGACIHVSKDAPTVIEDDVSIGHNAIVHGSTIHHGALIGLGAVVMDHAEIGAEAIIAAGAVVLQHTVVGAGEIWAGIPAKKMGMANPGVAADYAHRYARYIDWYKE